MGAISSNSIPFLFLYTRMESHFRTHRTIAKPKPRVRIIHIFDPVIIHTDVANFRELVQCLTGKPSVENKIIYGSNKRKEAPSRALYSNKRMQVAMPEGVKEEMWPETNAGSFVSYFPVAGGLVPEFDQFPVVEGNLRAPMYVHGDLEFA